MIRTRAAIGPLAGGLVVLAIALSPSAEQLAGSSLALHMAQHALLVVAAAPLLALGLPRLAGPLARVGRLVPAIALFALLGLLHLPAVVEALEAAPLLHAFAHGALLAAAFGVWLFVLPSPHALSPLPRMVLLVALTLAPMGAATVLALELPTFDGALAGTVMAAVGAIFAAVGIAGWIVQAEAAA